MSYVKSGTLVYSIPGIIFLTACNNATHEPASSTSRQSTDLNAIVTELPNAPGYQTFKMNCTSCHSARYVQIQPDFPEKTWTAVVSKMQKSFGAPFSDSSAKEIVNYLVAIKGKK